MEKHTRSYEEERHASGKRILVILWVAKGVKTARRREATENVRGVSLDVRA